MSSEKKVVIIGGTACGPKAAARARRLDPAARITLIERRDNLSTATCGMPYFISGLIKDREVMVTRGVDYFCNVFDMDVMIQTEAVNIDRKSHSVTAWNLGDGKESTIEYDKLVIATGASPIIPSWQGKDLDGVFTLSSLADTYAIHEYTSQLDTRDIAIVGAGLIGIEMAESFASLGFNVTMIEALDWMSRSYLISKLPPMSRNTLKTKVSNYSSDSPLPDSEVTIRVK